jgi:hypothetical protein
VDRLGELLGDPDWTVRHAAAETLERMAHDGIHVFHTTGKKLTIKRLAATENENI